jgi:hypothetical protein
MMVWIRVLLLAVEQTSKWANRSLYHTSESALIVVVLPRRRKVHADIYH